MTGDPRRDDHATEHHFIGGEDNDYVAYEQAQEAKRAQEQVSCGRRINFFAGVHTACGRPDGHDGDCHPVPLVRDKEDT